jgi:hypothetical protein
LIAGFSGAGIDSEFAVVFFDHIVQAETLGPPSPFYFEVPANNFVNGFSYTGGGTTIPNGVNACVAKTLDAQHAQKFLITVTDGYGGDVTASTNSAIAAGWTLIGVGVGSGTHAGTMNLLSGGNPDLLFQAIGFSDLADIIAEINEQVNCS